MEIAPGVHIVPGTRLSRIYLIEDKDALTLIDAGLPGSARRVFEYIERIGRRREELARILMAEPAMALLDEPGAGVNPTLLNLLIDDIRRACEERKVTFLLIEHNMNLVMNLCNPVVIVQNGALLTAGTPEEVRANPEVMQAYLGSRGSRH